MEEYSQSKLRKELHAVGANPREIEELLSVASKLRQLKQEASPKFGQDHWQWFVRTALLGGTGLAAGMFLIISSQAASPSSWLYPLQQLSDNIAVRMYPTYRANIMMKRAEQVNELVAAHASTQQILATLADYTQEANIYESNTHANYAAFEYCKVNLKQAAVTASPEVRQAITRSLLSLEKA